MKIHFVCVKDFFSPVQILNITGLFVNTAQEKPVSLHPSLILCVCSFGWMQFSFKLEFKSLFDAPPEKKQLFIIIKMYFLFSE